MRRMLAATLSAFALLAAPPAFAQDEAVAVATPDADQAAVEEPVAPRSDQTYIVSANDRFLTEYGTEAWLAADLEICLEEGETVQLARGAAQIISMELRGPLCTVVEEADEVASILVERERQAPRARTGATRGTRLLSGIVGNAVRAPGFRVASGSADVLEQFPRGTTVTRRTEICLERGQQVTLISNRGQRVTYRGPGCARRNVIPSADNIGGFTFGWNAHGARVGIVALP